MTTLEDNVRKIIAEERTEEIKELLDEMTTLYEQFHNVSRRVIYLLTGEQKSRTGLTDFIKSVFSRRGALCRKEIAREVTENFDPTISSKAISDSIRYLINIKYLEDFWDAEIKRRKYRVPRHKMQ